MHRSHSCGSQQQAERMQLLPLLAVLLQPTRRSGVRRRDWWLRAAVPSRSKEECGKCRPARIAFAADKFAPRESERSRSATEVRPDRPDRRWWCCCCSTFSCWLSAFEGASDSCGRVTASAPVEVLRRCAAQIAKCESRVRRVRATGACAQRDVLALRATRSVRTHTQVTHHDGHTTLGFGSHRPHISRRSSQFADAVGCPPRLTHTSTLVQSTSGRDQLLLPTSKQASSWRFLRESLLDAERVPLRTMDGQAQQILWTSRAFQCVTGSAPRARSPSLSWRARPSSFLIPHSSSLSPESNSLPSPHLQHHHKA